MACTLNSMDGFILLYGGEPKIPGELWDPHFYVMHTNTRQWSRVRTKGRLPIERAGHTTCISDDGIMYVWGGHYQRKYLNDLCLFHVKEYPSKAEWEFIDYQSQAPSARSGHVAVIHNHRLYIFGGINTQGLLNDIWYFDLMTHVWHPISAVGYIPTPRESCAAALVDDTIYIFGGRGIHGTLCGDLCAFRIKSQRWYMFQSMGIPPSPRFGLTLTAIQKKIYVFGGESIGKADDSLSLFVLDCTKIKYPPEPEPSESEKQERVIKEEPSIHLDEQRQTPPLRPSREGAGLDRREPSLKLKRDIHPRIPPTIQLPAPSHLDPEEKKRLLHELALRDTMITEMKKKEQWWRTEVSLARFEQNKIDDQESKSACLIQFDTTDKLVLFQQLVNIKTEIKKMKSSTTKQIEPIVQKIEQTEHIRMAALEEAAYYKATYIALKSHDHKALDLLESERTVLLEARLREAEQEGNRQRETLAQVKQLSQQATLARAMAEEQATKAQIQSEEAQEAHQTILEQLTVLYDKMMKAETQARQDAIQIAHLSNQLASRVSVQQSPDLSQLSMEMGRLETANIKQRNEMASLLTQLEQAKDEEIRLRILLNEKDQDYAEAVLALEQLCIEIELLKNVSHE
ncbi:uncharacterized protein B0P05DRAFT_620692 [Gilbertella persicaria]|uniref:uncharacterized protein n=1 Tax=Gilbertella persicaria TaxID=101096 RepID=UPI002220931D|nr:uncharacterized protein B0P05DRAFT_620692 [Gilbertella persicaria]KAI8067639.1 hypothetical protein B0P05DRAFT_620692 [Gilbertella persicaria]